MANGGTPAGPPTIQDLIPGGTFNPSPFPATGKSAEAGWAQLHRKAAQKLPTSLNAAAHVRRMTFRLLLK